MSSLEEEGLKAHDTQLATACQSLCIRGMDSLYLPFGINSFLIYNSKVHLFLSSSPRSNNKLRQSSRSAILSYECHQGLWLGGPQ